MPRANITPEYFLSKAQDESAHQKALFHWIRHSEWPELRFAFAAANGGDRNKAVALTMVLEGVQKGVPDFMVPVARRGYHGLFIELKKPGREREKDGGLSEHQVKYLNFLNEQGYCALVCYGYDHARQVITAYFGGIA